ncbi:LacI family transcriptional regulator [Microbacterium sp. ZKA21]|jgi:LacI family transcriptional regulator|uniref:LacI family DNA-binding transcriptional regulator n=1 Tax=Microbacterium sp. ZKA21 TaxID=3381694 RepID=UPI003D1E0166
MSKNPTVRLSDVATVAGVSIATASKALNDSPLVSAKTKAHVRDVAARLDFRPNALAQSFASGRSQVVGVLTHRAGSSFARLVVMGAILELGERERAALVYDGRVQVQQEMAESIRKLRDRRIDGLLVVGSSNRLVMPSVTHHFDVPVTYAYTVTDAAADTTFLPDDEAAGYLATRHLIEQGRTRIAHITAEEVNIPTRRREAGMRRALAEAGLEVVEILHGKWRQEWGSAAVAALIDRGVEFDALFCGNDHIGFGALEALAAHGRSVPDDVAVIGVDNWEEVIVDQEHRRLTSVDLDLAGLGRQAAVHVIGSDGVGGGERLTAPRLVLGPSA